MYREWKLSSKLLILDTIFLKNLLELTKIDQNTQRVYGNKFYGLAHINHKIK